MLTCPKSLPSDLSLWLVHSTHSLLSERLIELISSCLCQDKLKRVELELEEEKSSVEMMTDRVARSRDQIDQLRSELMQERSSKQDLELDKNAMERHVHTHTHTPHLTFVIISNRRLQSAEIHISLVVHHLGENSKYTHSDPPLECILGIVDLLLVRVSPCS